jgi:hypothetical protein
MVEKHLKSKETDVTGILAILLILIVGAAIVKLTGDFTAQKTSTSTKAVVSKKKATYTYPKTKQSDSNPTCAYISKTDAQICAIKVADSYYSPAVSRVIAGSGNGSCGDNSTFDVQGSWCTGALSSDFPKECVGLPGHKICSPVPHNLACCVSANEYTMMGTKYCNSFSDITDGTGKLYSPKPDAKCKSACNTTDGYNKTLYFNSSSAGQPLNIQVPAPCKFAKTEGTKGTATFGVCCVKVP